MQKYTYHFVVGGIAAALVTVSLAGLPILEAVSSSNKSAPELRLGMEIGILDASDFNGTLDASINRKSFAIMLKQVLQMLGDPAGSELSDLQKSGIFDPSPATKIVKRKIALEALAQCTMHLADNGLIKLENDSVENFVDYKVPAKYSKAINYLRTRQIVRGYPDGRFGAARNLSKREAAYLLSRYYEQVSAELIKVRRTDGLRFVDLPTDHPTMSSLRLIEKAGGFELFKFGISFDGNSGIYGKDACAIVKGILTKQGREAEAAKIDVLLTKDVQEREITRSDLAVLAAYLVNVFPPSGKEESRSFTYVDVEAGSRLADSLLVLGKYGIFMGYPNGFFKGKETVTRYETVGVLNAVLSVLQLVPPEKDENAPAAKADFEAYAELIKAKLARIQTINRRSAGQSAE